MQEHSEEHTQESSASLIFHTNYSDWMLVKCSECDKKFENKAPTCESISETLEVNPRIVQNLMKLDFDNDSEEDVEWTPKKDD